MLQIEFNNIGATYIGKTIEPVKLDFIQLIENNTRYEFQKSGFHNCLTCKIGNNKIKLFNNGTIQFPLSFKNYNKAEEDNKINEILNSIKNICNIKEFIVSKSLVHSHLNIDYELNFKPNDFYHNKYKDNDFNVLILGKSSLFISKSKNIDDISNYIHEVKQFIKKNILRYIFKLMAHQNYHFYANKHKHQYQN